MRVLVIGYGSIGRRHAQNARASGHEVSVMDLSEERRSLAGNEGCAVPAALDAGPEVEAVVIATPADTHAALMRYWLAKPMLVEKPIAANSVSLVGYTPLHCWVGYNWRWHPEVLAWRRRIGNSRWLHLCCDTRMAEWPGARYAAPLVECSHEIDLVRYLRAPQDVRLVAAGCFADGAGPTGRGRSCSGIWMQFDSGDLVDVAWEAPPRRRLVAHLSDREAIEIVASHSGPVLEQSYRDELRAFLNWVGSGCLGPAGCTLEDGVAALRICEEALKMTGEGAPC